ncbi:hypothetical protein RCG23_00605 [Neobacillus sp. PS3-34]|uniref:hypothetical protein n=1 Tax=Neobacillus sp. PS3-34 TaxID=3070678 RepID=UPI0027DFA0AC|nr:hypothetical protein [Neobacillus sp. PS3-34]WML48686.1 hypothetical protein RCG23_00605 [Neobacillus sp. PS3-34]
MTDFLSEFFSSLAGTISPTSTLNTQKIDKNIKFLLQYEWFKEIYEDEKYRRLFFVNRKIRGYLQSSIRTKKIISNQKSQEKFISFLNKQLNN